LAKTGGFADEGLNIVDILIIDIKTGLMWQKPADFNMEFFDKRVK
jgi:hypothetical protein